MRRVAMGCVIGLALCLAAPVVVPNIAEAQSSGGSFGGGSFRRRSSGSSGSRSGRRSYRRTTRSPSYRSSRRRSSYGSGYQGSGGGYSGSGGGYSSGGGSGGGLSALCCCGMFVLLIGGIIILSFFRRGSQQRGPGGPPRRVMGGIDVSGLMLAIDWRARAHVQGQLEALAQSGDTGTPEGLARLARETALALRREELSWLYGAVLNSLPATPENAEQVFRKAANDARAKFRHELIRNADGSSRIQDAVDVRASREEGEGVVVVTLLVAAHKELIDVSDITNAAEVKALLDQFVSLDAHSLAALEVIWSPAQDSDRMSTAELEILYPELRRINEQTLAGRVFCAYCSAPFAQELQTCPHCGAPAGEARR